MSITGSYIVLDNWDVSGKCWTAPASFGSNIEIKLSGTNIAVTNSYFHGWTEAYHPGSDMDQAPILGATGTMSANGNIADYDVFDGSDSTCTGVFACTGGPITYNELQYFTHSVCRYMANCLNPDAPTLVHDDLFENVFESYDPSNHGGIIEATGSIPNATQTWYNLMVRNTDMGIVFNPNLNGPFRFFNVVMFNNANGSNCLALANASGSGSNPVYISNVTFDNTNQYDSTTCIINLARGGAPAAYQGTITIQNGHWIGYGGSGCIPSNLIGSASGVNIVDAGNEVCQSESVANGQGYTRSNYYQPASANGATYHSGGDLSSSCATYSSDSGLCNGTTGGVTDSAKDGNTAALYIPSPPSRGTSWDAGAYQFGASDNAPSPPTGLAAVVQ